MLGEDTLFLTPKGFSPLKKLKLYDEVLTAYGTFEPIVALSEWQDVTSDYNIVQASTNEFFLCSDDVMWIVYDKYLKNHENIVFSDELCSEKHGAANTMDIAQCKNTIIYNPYDYCIVVPMGIPEEYLLSNRATRLECFAGLIDSPICEIGNVRGTYNFYTKYYPLEKGIVSLARSLGYLAYCDIIDNVTCVTIYVTSHEEIPTRDEYKKLAFSSRLRNVMKYKNVKKVSKVVNKKSRKVSINGGNAVIGYSLLPIVCQFDKN